MQDLYVVFPDNPTDLLTVDMGTPVTPQTIFSYAANMVGQRWIEPTPNFDPAQNNLEELGLNFYGVFGTLKEFQFTDSQGQNPYTKTAKFVGTRPTVPSR